MSAFQHLRSKKHKLGSLWFNAISANQEALLNLQCKYQAGKQRLWGIRTMNQPLPSLRSFLRNISTFQPSCCLVPTHLLQYKTSSSIPNITFWRETTHWTYSPPPCFSRRRKPSMLKGTTRISWILQLHGHCTFSWLSYLWSHTANHAAFSLWSHLFWQLAKDFHNNKAQEK